MKRNLFSLFRLALGVCLFTSLGFSQNADDVKECNLNIENPAKFKLLHTSSRLIREPFTVQIVVVVDRRNFNRGYMVRFARTIRARFCNETSIGVVILDEEKAYRNDPEIIFRHLAGIEKSPSIRGFYSFNTQAGRNIIGFSTRKDRPDDRIVIDLSKESDP